MNLYRGTTSTIGCFGPVVKLSGLRFVSQTFEKFLLKSFFFPYVVVKVPQSYDLTMIFLEFWLKKSMSSFCFCFLEAVWYMVHRGITSWFLYSVAFVKERKQWFEKLNAKIILRSIYHINITSFAPLGSVERAKHFHERLSLKLTIW